jgi:hypothetical protein
VVIKDYMRNRVGHASGKVGEKRRFGDACDAILDGTRWQKRVHTVREVGREARSSKTRDRNRPNTSSQGFKTRGKGSLWRGERILCPREKSRQGRHSVGREWAGLEHCAVKELNFFFYPFLPSKKD